MITATCGNTGSMKGLVNPGANGLAVRERQPDPQIPAHLGNGRARWRQRIDDRRHQYRASRTRSSAKPSRRAASRRSKATRSCGGRSNMARTAVSTFSSKIPGRECCYVEIKNVHFCARPGLAEFPDFGDDARRQAPGRTQSTWWPTAIALSWFISSSAPMRRDWRWPVISTPTTAKRSTRRPGPG